MANPDFTTEEQYLIGSLKVGNSSNTYMWSYLINGFFFALIAAYHENVPLLMCVFLVVCGFRIYEEYSGKKWGPMYQSIIEKYETALTELPSTSPHKQSTQADSR